MTKGHQEDQPEPLFITESVAAEMIAAGYEFAPPNHASSRWLPCTGDSMQGSHNNLSAPSD